MVLPGITAIGTMRMRLVLLVMPRKSSDHHWQGIYGLVAYCIQRWLTSFIICRYLHYYNRYMNHMQSLKFEHKLYASVKAKMEEMQQHNMSWIEVCLTISYFYRINFDLCIYFQKKIGPIPEKSRWYPLSVSSNAYVHLCFRVLPAEE